MNKERFELSIDVLKDIKETMEQKYNRCVDCLNDTENGRYRFADTEFNDVTVGVISFNYETGKYNEIQYNPHYKEDLQEAMDNILDYNRIKDLVLLSWANYTMNLITDIAYHSKDENALDIRDHLYSNYYVPIRMDDFNYSDAINDNPIGAKDNLIAFYHDNLRNDIKAFDDELNEDYDLLNSPYSRGLVVINGKVVDNDDIVVRHNNQVVVYTSSEYKIYLPLSMIEGFSEKDVKDTIVYKGEIFINSSYINDYE
mgnify:CR=1 FL=1